MKVRVCARRSAWPDGPVFWALGTRRWECSGVASVEDWLPWVGRAASCFGCCSDPRRGRGDSPRSLVGGKHRLHDSIRLRSTNPDRTDDSRGNDALDDASLVGHVGRCHRDRCLATRAAAYDRIDHSSKSCPGFRRATLARSEGQVFRRGRPRVRSS